MLTVSSLTEADLIESQTFPADIEKKKINNFSNEKLYL